MQEYFTYVQAAVVASAGSTDAKEQKRIAHSFVAIADMKITWRMTCDVTC